MKEFEKWRKARPDLHMAVFAGNARDGWKAALDWAENLFVGLPMGGCLSRFEIEELINKELRNG